MDKKTINPEVDNFFCLSIAYNPITDISPRIFEIENKDKKVKFTEDILANKLGGIFEYLVMLKTCQRVEFYFHSKSDIDEISSEFISFYKNFFNDDIRDFLKIYPSKHALKHLISLCTGLESFIICESEIYQQVIKLFYYYKTNKYTSEKLIDIFDYSIRIASKIRKDILKEGNIVSYPELLNQFMTERSLNEHRIVILGKGLLSQTILNSLIASNTPNGLREDSSLENINNNDLIVNCSSKMMVDENTNLKGNRMIDFSMPPVFEKVSDKFLEYYSLKDFGEHIEENNHNIAELRQRADKYIEESISLV